MEGSECSKLLGDLKKGNKYLEVEYRHKEREYGIKWRAAFTDSGMQVLENARVLNLTQ